MKYCEKYVPALSALADGELSEAERDEVLAHLETCEGCRAYLAELSAMHAALDEMEEYDAPEGFAEGVLARLHESAAPKKRTHRTAWLASAACAAIVIFAVGGPLRGQFGAKSASDGTATEAAMLTMAESEECAEEEYEDNFASVQSAPMTMTATGRTASENAWELPAINDFADIEPTENGIAPGSNDLGADATAELPRSVVFVYGASREDYLIELATGFDYYADGSAAGYDLPTEKLDEFLALLDADGVKYNSSVAKQATTFYVQYEEGNTNG